MMIITNLGDTTRVDWTQKAVLARTFIINYIIILFFAPPTARREHSERIRLVHIYAQINNAM